MFSSTSSTVDCDDLFNFESLPIRVQEAGTVAMTIIVVNNEQGRNATDYYSTLNQLCYSLT